MMGTSYSTWTRRELLKAGGIGGLAVAFGGAARAAGNRGATKRVVDRKSVV